MSGSIRASCGHELANADDGVDVRYAGEDCDPVDGFTPCVFYAHFCPECAADWKARGMLLTDEEAERFFDKD